MSKSENKKSAAPKTPVASKAGNATGTDGTSRSSAKPDSSMTTPNKKAEPDSGEKESVSDSHQTRQNTRYTPGPLYAEGRCVFKDVNDQRFLIATVEDHDEAEADATLFAVAPELFCACKFFICAIEDGDLVRDITKDNDPGWAMKMMKFATDLGKAASAISRAEGRAS